jgi:hypothetical protein
MSAAPIEIELEQEGETAVSPPHYQPTDEIKGVVTLTADRPLKAQPLTISLVWRVEGSAVTPQTITSQEAMVELPAAATQSLPFAFSLPAQPWSYEGQVVSIVWHVEARLGKGRRSQLTQAALVMRP